MLKTLNNINRFSLSYEDIGKRSSVFLKVSITHKNNFSG